MTGFSWLKLLSEGGRQLMLELLRRHVLLCENHGPFPEHRNISVSRIFAGLHSMSLLNTEKR
jgi:hypothetical protein